MALTLRNIQPLVYGATVEHTNMSEVKLTKSVPLSIILGLLLQAGCLIWYMSRLDGRVSANENKLNDRKEWMASREDFEKTIANQMIRLTMSIDHLTESTKELKSEVKELNKK